MLEETIQLETLRQQIEAAEMESGSMSDYLDRGRPNEKERKSAQERMSQMDEEAKKLKAQLQALIAKSSREAVEEWVNWHTGVLQGILLEEESGVNSKTRKHVARTTLAEWERVLQGEQEHVGINWYFLKDYKEKAQKTFKGGRINTTEKPVKSWWKVWE